MDERQLEDALDALSAWEQIRFLVQATRSLSRREGIDVWQRAGFSVLRDRLLPVLLHIVLKRVLAGALLWMASGVVLVVILLALAVIEQLNANAVGPVLVGTISFLVGFLLFGFIDFLGALFRFFRTTSKRHEREALLARLNACEHVEKLTLLRGMSTALAHQMPGESLLESLVSVCAFFFCAVILVGFLLEITAIFPAIGNFPWLLFVVGGALLLGFFVPNRVQWYLSKRHRAW